MATKIVTKNSSTASAVPTASDLVQGELAVNVADKRLFTEDNGGSIVELGTNPTTLTVDTTTLVVDSTNNRVGIGTSSPANTLTVGNTADSADDQNATVGIKCDANHQGIMLQENSGSEQWSLGVNADGDLNFYDSTVTTPTVTFKDNGGVGIGTSSPDSLMHLSSNTGATLTLESTDTGIATNEVIGEIDFFSNDASGIGAASRGSISLIAADAAGAGSMLFKTSNASSASAEAMRIDSSGNVGIGTASASSTLEIAKNDQTNGATLSITNTFNSGGWDAGDIIGSIDFRTDDISTTQPIRGQIKLFEDSASGTTYANSNAMSFSTGLNNTLNERMRIDSSGNVSIGTTTAATALGTSTSSSDTGVSMAGTGRISIANNNSYPLALNRYTSEGSLIQLNEAGVTRGAIGIKGNEPFIVDTAAGLRMSGQGTANVLPVNSVGNATNQALNLGSSTLSFDTVFADDFTNTSDRNYKQDIEELLEAELRVATACKGLMKKYRMKHAVVKKGDDARIHVGIIAQDLRDAFTAEGLDAGRYGMFVSETVWEESVEVPSVEAADAVYETQTDEEGNESQVLISEAIEAVDGYTDVNHYWTEEEAPDTAVARTKMGVRYSQLLAFIIAAL